MRRGFEVLGVRELSAEDVKGLKRAKLPAFKRLRHAHHRLALLLATGMSQQEVADVTGYSTQRVHILNADPAFQNLIAAKRGLVEAQSIDDVADFNKLILTNGLKAEQLIADRLDAAIDGESEDEIPWAVLLKASRDAADRVGLAKRSVTLTGNVDFASRLDKAIQRSRMKVIESSAVASAASAADAGEGRSLNQRASPPLLVHDAPVMKPVAEGTPASLVHPRPLVTRRGAA